MAVRTTEGGCLASRPGRGQGPTWWRVGEDVSARAGVGVVGAGVGAVRARGWVVFNTGRGKVGRDKDEGSEREAFQQEQAGRAAAEREREREMSMGRSIHKGGDGGRWDRGRGRGLGN